MMMGSMGFGVMETLFPMMFAVVFIVVVGMFIMIAVRGTKEWHRNNNSPVLTVDAVIVTKRQKHTRHEHSGSTWYYATFEVESGDRMELSVSGAEYGMLAEGDRGQLTFQGTRYLGFERV